MARILYADDSATARTLGREILGDAGHEVVTFASAAEARANLADVAPDMVVLDVVMNGTPSGFDLARDIRTAPRSQPAPILLVIGKMELPEQRGLDFAIADGVVTKPFEATELLRNVDQILRAGMKRGRADYEGFRAVADAQSVPQLWPAAAVASMFRPKTATPAVARNGNGKEAPAPHAVAERPSVDAVAEIVERVMQRMKREIIEEVKRELGK